MTGKTAHGAMPEQGVNAIEAASEIIHLVERLKRYHISLNTALNHVYRNTART